MLNKSLRVFACAALAAAFMMFGTGAQATQYGVVFDPFTGTALLDVTCGDGCTIDLLPGTFIDSPDAFGCCWTSPGEPDIGIGGEVFNPDGSLAAFDSAPIPLSLINPGLPSHLFANVVECDPSLVFTSMLGENEISGHIAQLVCTNDPTMVLDDAIYRLTRVPEPGTLALILGGVGAFWLTRRRRAAP